MHYHPGSSSHPSFERRGANKQLSSSLLLLKEEYPKGEVVKYLLGVPEGGGGFNTSLGVPEGGGGLILTHLNALHSPRDPPKG